MSTRLDNRMSTSEVESAANADNLIGSPNDTTNTTEETYGNEVLPKKRKLDEIDHSAENEVNSYAHIKGDVTSQDENDDGTFCPICLEPWTNSGGHRIASLKCGHFFGLACIEKWLRTSGANDCPNCNEKASRKDIRPHYVARLKAVDTADQDRALQELERVKCEMRSLELEHTTLKVTNAMQRDEIDKLRRKVKTIGCGVVELCSNNEVVNMVLPGPSASNFANAESMSYSRLLYVKRMELIAKPDRENRERYCRVMAYNETHGMLAATQPSFTALAPGFGVRRLNMLDLRVEKYISLHREPIRDLAFNPVMQDQLLSVSQDKTARLTNISSCAEIQRYQCAAEVWACCWDADTPTTFFVGTKRSQIYLFDTRDSSGTIKGHARQRYEGVLRTDREFLNFRNLTNSLY